MNKNLRYWIFSVALIVVMLAGGLFQRPIASAQDNAPTIAGGQPPIVSHGSTNQLSGSENEKDEPSDGQIITRILRSGAPIHGTNGVYFGPDGYLYIASCFSGAIW